MRIILCFSLALVFIEFMRLIVVVIFLTRARSCFRVCGNDLFDDLLRFGEEDPLRVVIARCMIVWTAQMRPKEARKLCLLLGE